MTKAQIWKAIEALPITPMGIAERLKLIAMTPDDLNEEDTQDEQTTKDTKHTKPLRAVEPNWYHGLSRRELERWIKLREAGIIADLGWWGGDRATGIRYRRIRLVEPMQCRPVPERYSGKFYEKGMW